jgi:hypothetical protein
MSNLAKKMGDNTINPAVRKAIAQSKLKQYQHKDDDFINEFMRKLEKYNINKVERLALEMDLYSMKFKMFARYFTLKNQNKI